MQRNLPPFALLEHIKAAANPLTLEEIKSLPVDFDPDMYKDWGEAPVDYPCPDDDMPIIAPVTQTTGAPDPSSGQEIITHAEGTVMATEDHVLGKEKSTTDSPENPLEQASQIFILPVLFQLDVSN